LEIRNLEVTKLDLSQGRKIVVTENGSLETKALIITSGATPQRLDIEGEDLFTGKGVSYCATCDGPFYRDMNVAVVGGGDTALEEAIFLTRFASKVFLIHRRDRLRATKLLQERAKTQEKINFVWDSVVTQITGDTGVKGVTVKNVKTGEEVHLAVEGIFIFIGYCPNNQLAKGILDFDDRGFILTDINMETSVPGVFAAGDIRSKLLRQVSTAVGEGATAAVAAERYLENLK